MNLTELYIDTKDRSDQYEVEGTQSELDDIKPGRYKEISLNFGNTLQ